jgi:hypothetical protein
MLEKKSYFPGQNKNEHIVFYFNRHYFYLLKKISSLVFIIFLTILIFFVWMFVFKENNETWIIYLDRHRYFLLFFYFIFLLETHFIFLSIFNYLLSIIIVTDTRIVEIDKSVFLLEHQESVDIEMIQDIQSNKEGFLQHLFNYGNIQYTFLSNMDKRKVDYIYNPLKVIEYINGLKYRKIERRDRKSDLSEKKDLKTERKKDLKTNIRQKLRKIF